MKATIESKRWGLNEAGSGESKTASPASAVPKTGVTTIETPAPVVNPTNVPWSQRIKAALFMLEKVRLPKETNKADKKVLQTAANHLHIGENFCEQADLATDPADAEFWTNAAAEEFVAAEQLIIRLNNVKAARAAAENVTYPSSYSHYW
jgi:hypothetical protein